MRAACARRGSTILTVLTAVSGALARLSSAAARLRGDRRGNVAILFALALPTLVMVVLGGMGHVPGVVAGALLLSIFPVLMTAGDKLLIYATAVSVELAFYTALASLMALPWLRRRYYAAKFWIDRAAGLAIGLLGLSLILRH